MKFTPRPYQEAIISRIFTQKRVGVWAGMGMGKTTACLTALSLLRLVEPEPVLVLAPLRVAQSTWPDEVAKWEHLSGLRVSVVVGSADQRRKALAVAADIYTMNYDNLPWLLDEVGDAWPFRTVIADESTRLKSFRLGQGGKRARALGKVAFSRVRRFIELTGTPSPNGLADLWGQAWFLDRGERLGRTHGAFIDRWFHKQPMPDGYNVIRPRAFADEQIQSALSDICFSLDARDYFDLREPIANVVEVDLPPAVRRDYEQFEREMWVELAAGGAVEAVSAAARTIKCLQFSSGALYQEDGPYAVVHDQKLDALESIVEEAAGAPVLVAYHFKSDLERLRKRFKFARVLDKDPQTLRDWNAGKLRMLLAHPASAGHGLNLQDGGNILVFFTCWWNLEEHQQIIERIGPTRQAQAGHDRPVFLHYITARDTVDGLVLQRLRQKRSVQDVLLGALKHAA